MRSFFVLIIHDETHIKMRPKKIVQQSVMVSAQIIEIEFYPREPGFR